ncbi:MAG: DUF4340 domain-containing protein [Saprospiraceae bacterium]
MKRTWLLIALFLLLGIGVFYTVRQKNKQAGGSHVSWDMDFAVPDTASVTRIFLADRKGRTATLTRKGDHWLYNNTYRARPTAVQTLLATLHSVNVRYIPTKSAEEGMIKSLAAEGIKVEVYGKENNLIKSYYVGGVTSDETGTYMIMDGAEQPYVTHIPSFVGQLRIRYMLGDDNWRDRAVFFEKVEEIRSVSVEYPQQKSASFKIEKVGDAQYEVRPFYSTTPVSKVPQRKGTAEAYLLQFERLVAEAYETSNTARDSVTALVPFAIVSLTKTDSTTKQVRFWPVSLEEKYDGQQFVIRYFTDVNGGEAFLLTQHHVFGPIFRDYTAFFNKGAQPFPN